MNILLFGNNYEKYIAKCHEAWREGFRQILNAKSYGKGYPDYDSHDDYRSIINKTFPDGQIDLVAFYLERTKYTRKLIIPKYFLHNPEIKKATFLCDYWSEAYAHERSFMRLIRKSKINYILSFFKQPVDKYKEKLDLFGDNFIDIIWFPPSFNPRIFTDWKLEKKYDVGFLAAGTTSPNLKYYPERYHIHQQLLKTNLKYLYAKHPGWGDNGNGIFNNPHELVGENFSRLINSCMIFVTTGGKYKTFNPKYMEILASKSCLFATEPYDVESTGLIDGVNYVKINADDAVDKIYEYLNKPEEIERIAENGYQLAMNRYSCFALTENFRKYYESIN
jgi:hypothetical protein